MSSGPVVYVLIPVFNRLAHTREVISCLRRQKGVDVRIVIVDDSSTDGTGEFLAAQSDVMTLRGNGDLWWGGAIHLALKTIHPLLKAGDFFVFMNNDTRVDDNFLSVLVATSLANGRAAVGSVVRASTTHELLSIGPTADLWVMAIWDVLRDIPESERLALKETYAVDFLSGRGSLYPGEVLNCVGYMWPYLLPHYHADYEFADRVHRSGFKQLVTSKAVTYSTEEFGNERKLVASFWRRKFGKASHENALHRVALFCLIGSPAQRVTAIPRMLFAWIGRKWHPVRCLPSRVVGRLGVLLSSPFSSVARAKFAAALERRGARRKEALQVYAAALLKELRGGKVLLLCSAAGCYEPFFRKLSIATESIAQLSDNGRAECSDFVFCATDCAEMSDLPEPEQLAKLVRPRGIIFCAIVAKALPLAGVTQWKERLAAMPAMELLVDGLADSPLAGSMASMIPRDTAVYVTGRRRVEEPLRFFAVRKLR